MQAEGNQNQGQRGEPKRNLLHQIRGSEGVTQPDIQRGGLVSGTLRGVWGVVEALPSPNDRIEAGDALIAAGSKEALERLERL